MQVSLSVIIQILVCNMLHISSQQHFCICSSFNKTFFSLKTEGILNSLDLFEMGDQNHSSANGEYFYYYS